MGIILYVRELLWVLKYIKYVKCRNFINFRCYYYKYLYRVYIWVDIIKRRRDYVIG